MQKASKFLGATLRGSTRSEFKITENMIKYIFAALLYDTLSFKFMFFLLS